MTLDFSHPETLGIMKVKPPHPRIQASNGRFKSLVAHRNSKSWSRGHEVSHFRVMDSVLEMNRPSSNEWKTERFEFYQIRNTDPRLLQSRCIAFMFVCLSLEGNAASHFGKSVLEIQQFNNSNIHQTDGQIKPVSGPSSKQWPRIPTMWKELLSGFH